jgi:Methyltransferase domain
MERVWLNLGTETAVRALERGELPWTLHPACEFASDPGQWGASLINNAEVMTSCLDIARATSVVEVGAYAGDLTRLLLAWSEPSGARVWAIDPSPQKELVALAESRPELELVQETSHQALRHVPRADAYVIDGDHNYYTVAEELRLIVAAAGEQPLPLLMLHDVGWPHGHRDDYFAPELIPSEYRQPTVEGGGLFPGRSAPQVGGLPYKWPAANEGGPRNGVLTAVQDFLDGQDRLRLAILPSFFGLGIVWHLDAPYAERLAQLLDPLDRNPIIERLEANRAFHLAAVHQQMMEVTAALDRLRRQEQLLRRMLRSSAFAIADRLSRIRVRARIAPADMAVSREEILRALADEPERGRGGAARMPANGSGDGARS